MIIYVLAALVGLVAYLFVGTLYGRVSEHFFLKVKRNPGARPVTRGERAALWFLFPMTRLIRGSLKGSKIAKEHEGIVYDVTHQESGLIGKFYDAESHTCPGYVQVMAIGWPLPLVCNIFVFHVLFIVGIAYGCATMLRSVIRTYTRFLEALFPTEPTLAEVERWQDELKHLREERDALMARIQRLEREIAARQLAVNKPFRSPEEAIIVSCDHPEDLDPPRGRQ